MSKKHDIQEQVARAMNSLEGLSPAAANPHLYTRIKAKLEQERSSWSWLAAFLSRPAVAVALVLFVILLNVLTITSKKPGSDDHNDQLVSIAQEYSFQSSNILEADFNQP